MRKASFLAPHTAQIIIIFSLRAEVLIPIYPCRGRTGSKRTMAPLGRGGLTGLRGPGGRGKYVQHSNKSGKEWCSDEK